MRNEIKIPFNKWSLSKLDRGKRATSRTKKYGEIGDFFFANDRQFEIVGICKFPTQFIINFLYNIEGAGTKEELRMVLNGIFRRSKGLPLSLYTHFFIEVKA